MRRSSSLPWGGIVALVIAGIGLVVGSSLAFQGTSSPFAQMLFSPETAARWYELVPRGFILAVSSGIAVVLSLVYVFRWADRSPGRVAAFLASLLSLLPSPPTSDAGPPDVDGFRDREVDAQARALKMERLRKDGHGGNR